VVDKNKNRGFVNFESAESAVEALDGLKLLVEEELGEGCTVQFGKSRLIGENDGGALKRKIADAAAAEAEIGDGVANIMAPTAKKMKRALPETFKLMDRMKPGVNTLEGLSLYNEAISETRERSLIEFVEENLKIGRKGNLPGETFTRGSKTIKGNGRQVLQYGAKYNFMKHAIEPEAVVEPIPPILEKLIDHLTSIGALPAAVRPDTIIINVYNEGDCIPPHIDHPIYPRPFSTLSLLSPASMLLGTYIKALGDGRFKAPFDLTAKPRSLIVFNGNGADMAKHCIPPVATRRISITMRRMPDFARPICNKRFVAMANNKLTSDTLQELKEEAGNSDQAALWEDANQRIRIQKRVDPDKKVFEKQLKDRKKFRSEVNIAPSKKKMRDEGNVVIKKKKSSNGEDQGKPLKKKKSTAVSGGDMDWARQQGFL